MRRYIYIDGHWLLKQSSFTGAGVRSGVAHKLRTFGYMRRSTSEHSCETSRSALSDAVCAISGPDGLVVRTTACGAVNPCSIHGRDERLSTGTILDVT